MADESTYREASKQTLIPADPAARSGVAQVILDYPDEGFQKIVVQANQAASGDPEARKRLADTVSQKSEETKDYQMNTRPQWGNVFLGLLTQNLGAAYKAYNGGFITEEEARTPTGQRVIKEYNERGANNVYRDIKTGRQLTSKEVQDLMDRGGVISKSDEQAIKTTDWQNAQTNSKLANLGLTSQFNTATNDAYNAARYAGAANRNIDEQLKLSGSLKDVLNHFGSLPQEKRQRILGYVNTLNMINKSQSSEASRRFGAQAGGLQSESAQAGLGLGTGAGGAGGAEGAIVPPGAKIGANANLGGTTLAQTTTNVNAAESKQAAAAASAGEQTTQNLQAKIMEEMQGVIKPEQFNDFIRFNALNADNEAAYKNIPNKLTPPGYVNIPETDPNLSGHDAIIQNRVVQQRNNALLAAWSRDLVRAQREQILTGKSVDLDALSEKFQKSDIYKAIHNTYDYKYKTQISGRNVRPPKGSLIVDSHNQVGISPGE